MNHIKLKPGEMLEIEIYDFISIFAKFKKKFIGDTFECNPPEFKRRKFKGERLLFDVYNSDGEFVFYMDFSAKLSIETAKIAFKEIYLCKLYGSLTDNIEENLYDCDWQSEVDDDNWWR